MTGNESSNQHLEVLRGVAYRDEGWSSETRQAVRWMLELLDMEDPWPLPDVLSKLIESTEHLLAAHQCDTHGHEEYRYAAQRGRAILHNLNARPAVETAGEPSG